MVSRNKSCSTTRGTTFPFFLHSFAFRGSSPTQIRESARSEYLHTHIHTYIHTYSLYRFVSFLPRHVARQRRGLCCVCGKFQAGESEAGVCISRKCACFMFFFSFLFPFLPYYSPPLASYTSPIGTRAGERVGFRPETGFSRAPGQMQHAAVRSDQVPRVSRCGGQGGERTNAREPQPVGLGCMWLSTA